MIDESFLDEIYEAAHIPAFWPRILDRLSGMTDGWGGMLFTVTPEQTRWTASAATDDFFRDFLAAGWMARNPLVERGVARNHAGFLTDLDLFSESEIAAEPMYADMRRLGGGWHLGTAIHVPNGDTLVFNIERRHEHGAFVRAQAEELDVYRPHLARAALLAARYTQARFESTVGDLDALGLAAGAISSQGRLLACNTRFARLIPATFLDRTGTLMVRNASAQGRLAAFLARFRVDASRAGGASIPLRAEGERGAAVIHLVPVLGQARDIFTRTACLVVVTTTQADRLPSTQIVQGLFDLTPAEARVATEIAKGAGAPQVARALGIAAGTVRVHLKSIFGKIGITRQSELVALLTGLTLPL